MRMSRRDLYALGEPFGDSATQIKVSSKDRIYGDGGDGGSPAPTQTTVQNTNLPDYVQPYVMSMLGAAQNQMFNMDSSGNITGFKPYTPYSTDPSKYVAGFSPLQTQAQQGTANLQLPGQYASGSQLAGAGGAGSLGIAGQAANAGQNYYGMATNPYAVGQFMNPYIQQSLQPQLNAIAQQGNIAAQQAAGQATSAGAFGGTRSALQQNLAQQNALMAQQAAIGQGYNQAYNQAQNAIQYGAGLGLQGQQAALQGYGQAGQAANILANIGQQQLQGQQGILSAQAQAGAQQQAQQQNIINQAIQNYAQQQQMPLQSLSNLSALLHGLPLQNTTTQSYQAAPSTISQIAGLGTGIAGISKLAAKGGSVKDIKKMAGGGIASLENRQRIAENYPPQVLQQEVQRGVLPVGIGADLTQDYSNMQQAAEGMKAQQAAAAQPEGIPALPSNLPVTGMAGGGIIAFADGDVVREKTVTRTRDPLHWDYEAEKPDYTQADAMIAAAQAAPHTMDELMAARQAEEQKRGITDVYTPMLAKLKEKEAALADKQNRAQGLALLAASAKMMGSTSPYAGVGIGAGLGEYAANYGAASEKLDALKENYDQQNNTVMLAQNAYKEAALTNDTNRMDKAKAAIVAAQENKQKLQQEYLKLKDTGNLEKAKKTADYYKDIEVEKLKGANAHITDMRFGVQTIYDSLTKPGPNGEPPKMAPGPQAQAAALKQYQQDTGMTLEKLLVMQATGQGKLDAAQTKNYNDALKNDPQYQILKTKMSVMKPDNPNYAAVQQQISDLETQHMRETITGSPKADTTAKPAPKDATGKGGQPMLTATKTEGGKTITITSTDGGVTWKDSAGNIVK